MKILFKILITLFLANIITSCSTNNKIAEPVVINLDSSNELTIELSPGKSFNHPTFVIWVEDVEGNYLKTLYITKAYASGTFHHKMIGDSLWVNESGKSIQPAALPYWTYKKGLINNKNLIPTPENPFVDAYTGATPQGAFKLSGNSIKMSKYRILLEVNQPWDWNHYWTNNKYPNNSAYKHSAQPSIIFSVTINPEQSEFYLNPIGHGSPTGEDGKLYTNLTTITSALNIFSSIKLTLNK